MTLSMSSVAADGETAVRVCSRVERGNGDGEGGDSFTIQCSVFSVHSTSTGFARIGMRMSPLGREG
jgi:hypothetical protein